MLIDRLQELLSDESLWEFASLNGARELHRSWRDKMLDQGREIHPPERMQWSTLPLEDRWLDTNCAYDVLRDFAVWLLGHLELGEEETPDIMRREKDARIYYQKIVYAVCRALDTIDGFNYPSAPGVICGTLEMPTTQVEDRMMLLVKQVRALGPLQGGLYNVATRKLDFARKQADAYEPASILHEVTETPDYWIGRILALEEILGILEDMAKGIK